MRLGRYDIVRPLGAGGQGRVYEAVLHGPSGPGRVVALKVLEGGDGLRREARLGGLLRHPNLVDVYEVGEDHGTWFCAMELCRGGALSDRAPLSPRAVVEVGLQVCAALQYAHEELGLVHQDLKPANLLLDGPTVKVADLGIARVPGADAKRTAAGTPGYMAPEQAMAGDVDARADVFALGVTLLELATGAGPAPSLETMTPEDALDGEGERPAEEPPDWLAPVVARCLAPDRDDRWASMAALASALRALRVEGPSLADLSPAPPDPVAGPDPTFVGRRSALDTVARHLEEGPVLLTLRGPAGIGKTRLAHEAAARWCAHTGARAWFCDLAPARSLDALLHAVATALDVPLGRGDPHALVDQLGHAMGARGRDVVVLDNFEQVIASADVVARWRRLGGEARLLVTSREALRLPEERVLDVEPLDDDDAVALLEARARDRGVELAGDPFAAELARRLDGVPLALELAAGRLGVLTTRDVLDRLGLALLRTARTDLPERQATLRGALDWSWELLQPGARGALARLSVFAGGGAPEAIEAVLGEGGLDAVEALVDQSLVRFDARRGRFSLLAPVREYASSKLDEVERREAEGRHSAWYAARWGPSALEALDGPGSATRSQALVDDRDELGVACRRAIERADGPLAAATAAAITQVVAIRGPFLAGATLVRDALQVVTAPASRAELRMAEARLLQQAGRAAEAREGFDAAVRTFREVGDRRREGRALAILSSLLANTQRPDEARATAAEAITALREARDPSGEAVAQCNLGSAWRAGGQLDEADRAYRTALDGCRVLGMSRLEGVVVGNLALVAFEQGRLDEARELYEQALALHRAAGDRRTEAIALGNLGNVHLEQGRRPEAAAAYEAALALHREVGNRRFEAQVTGNLGILHALEGRGAEARRFWERALDRHRELGDRYQEGVVLANLGKAALLDDRLEEASDRFAEAVVVGEALGSAKLLALACAGRGELLMRAGDPGAGPLLARAERMFRELGDRVGLGHVLCGRARLASAEGAPAEAHRLLAEAERDVEALGLSFDTELASRVAETRAALGPDDPGRADAPR